MAAITELRKNVRQYQPNRLELYNQVADIAKRSTFWNAVELFNLVASIISYALRFSDRSLPNIGWIYWTWCRVNSRVDAILKKLTTSEGASS